MRKIQHASIAAIAVVSLLVTAAAAAQDKPRGRKDGDPRTECLRESERTHPPRTITRQQRDMQVEACLQRRR